MEDLIFAAEQVLWALCFYLVVLGWKVVKDILK